MADAGYPLPRFHFSVDLGDGTIINCSEVTGLNLELDVIEYRDGASSIFSTQKMSGLQKSSDVVIKKGIFVDDKKYYEWFKEVKMNTPSRQVVTIQLLDEEGASVMTWKLQNAWPSKVDHPEMKSDASEVAIETITIVHEGLTME